MNKWTAIALFAVLVGCSKVESPDAVGRGAAAPSHKSLARTNFAVGTELFVEFPPLVSGEAAAFAVHITRLADFSPLKEGAVSVRLTGGGFPDESASAEVSSNPGIYRPQLTPRHAGKRRLVFAIDAGGISETHDVGEVTVYSRAADVRPDAETATEAGIRFTKEQQWSVPFGSAPVFDRPVRESIAVNATIRPRPDGEAYLSAPGAGLLRAGPAGFPRVGAEVQAGRVVAYLLPRMGAETDAAALDLAVQRARIEAQQARQEHERIEGLFAIEAVPEKRLREARAREDLARAELTAAQRRAATYAGGAGGIALKSPIRGTIVGVNATPGGAVADGANVIHIADLGRLWLEAKVPESDIGKLASPSGAFLKVAESEAAVVLDSGSNARLVASGGAVDPATRTVPVIFEFDNARYRLRAGMNVQAHVYTGRVVNGPVVPATAIVDDGGQAVVFVQTGGESFARRVVQTGVRDANWVAIVRGLASGERVVTKGAYEVRLSAAGPASAGEGHVH